MAAHSQSIVSNPNRIQAATDQQKGEMQIWSHKSASTTHRQQGVAHLHRTVICIDSRSRSHATRSARQQQIHRPAFVFNPSGWPAAHPIHDPRPIQQPQQHQTMTPNPHPSRPATDRPWPAIKSKHVWIFSKSQIGDGQDNNTSGRNPEQRLRPNRPIIQRTQNPSRHRAVVHGINGSKGPAFCTMADCLPTISNVH
ncbi:hypothetical protein ACLOJK_008712 [Asimina triloba]